MDRDRDSVEIPCCDGRSALHGLCTFTDTIRLGGIFTNLVVEWPVGPFKANVSFRSGPSDHHRTMLSRCVPLTLFIGRSSGLASFCSCLPWAEYIPFPYCVSEDYVRDSRQMTRDWLLQSWIQFVRDWLLQNWIQFVRSRAYMWTRVVFSVRCVVWFGMESRRLQVGLVVAHPLDCS